MQEGLVLFKSLAPGFPILDFLFEVCFFLLAPDLLIVHLLDGVLERVDNFFLLGVALVLFIQLRDNLAQVLFLLFDVHRVSLQIVVLLLLQLLVKLLVEARDGIIELIVDLEDFLLLLDHLLFSHVFVLIFNTRSWVTGDSGLQSVAGRRGETETWGPGGHGSVLAGVLFQF